jgi:hypothetical protein
MMRYPETRLRPRQAIILAALAIMMVLGLSGAAQAATSGAVVVVPPAISMTPFITASQCAFCHGSNLDNFKNPILSFKHDPHLGLGIRCSVCHNEFPHTPDGTIKPSMTVCFNCHSLSHGESGTVASGACGVCHPNGYGGAPSSHTSDFRTGAHKDAAKVDYFPCLTCHSSDMCAACHTAKAVKPKNHIDAGKWKKQHGTLRDTGGCEICHTKAFCNSCHVTPMPHPAQWEGDHRVAAKSMKRDCSICHADSQAECSSCHHQFKSDTLLVQKNCEQCHVDYKEPLSSLIWLEPVGTRSKGIIIHKAHFEMTKTDPFACDECHDRTFSPSNGCFTFELCYTCHGKMRGGSLIAKWGGQELCYRCHLKK